MQVDFRETKNNKTQRRIGAEDVRASNENSKRFTFKQTFRAKCFTSFAVLALVKRTIGEPNQADVHNNNNKNNLISYAHAKFSRIPA